MVNHAQMVGNTCTWGEGGRGADRLERVPDVGDG